MGSIGSTNPWAPYGNYNDCSQGICSIYCPQWCYILFPPPPPFELSNDDSGTNFSPLIIAVIGILAGAFLLVSYYTILHKYCSRTRADHSTSAEHAGINSDQTNQDSWQAGPTGLDEALINSITVCKYKKGDGLVEGSDCSVCLNEFREDESLRLLPKCSHAFHLPCIDTWLKSNSTCPLCRSNIIAFINNPLPHQLPAPISEATTRPSVIISALEFQHRNDSVLVVHDLEIGVQHEAVVISLVGCDHIIPKTPIQGVGDKEEAEESDSTIEIIQEGFQQFRRSVSWDSSSMQGQVSIADILCEDGDDLQVGNLQFLEEGYGKSSNGRGVLHLVRNRVAMKRSISTGRFMFSRHGKGRNSIIPN